ncbi:MAG TPA: hypothetical protein PK156_11005 [Polyangium sp.]|nr:hypothetical protein [Polyangium sp.]
MRAESVQNLLGGLDAGSFRDIVRLALKARGYQAVPTDGPYDGGADFLLFVRGHDPLPCAVQVSVEKDWRKKLKEDARKAASQKKYASLLFASSRRIPNREFVTLQDDLEQKYELRILRMDAQEIAELAIDKGFLNSILTMLHIPISTESRKFERPDFRKDLAYSCAFFSTEARELRNAVLDEAIMTSLVRAQGHELREVVVDQVMLSLALAANQQPRVIAAIDRLLQKGLLTGKNGHVSISEKDLRTRQAVNALQESNVEALRKDIDECIEPHLKHRSRLETVRGAIFEDLGALLLATAERTSAAISNRDFPVARINERLRHLDMTLTSLGLDAATRQTVIADLGKRASSSQVGKHLISGEIIMQLFGLRTSHSLTAIEGRKNLTVILDTPVAMPLICNLLYSTANQEFFAASQHAYDQLLAHGIAIVLPDVYLEEIATHLISAHRDYSHIVGLDSDLKMSTNAFVAHYVAMKQAAPNSVGEFRSYLEAYGLNDGLAKADYYVIRDALIVKLEALAGRYHMLVKHLDTKPNARRFAEEQIALAMQTQGTKRRPKILLDHDVKVIAWLHERVADHHTAHVLVTWDRLQSLVNEQCGNPWDVLDPVALGDMLAVAAPDGHELEIASPWVYALGFSDEDAQRGAHVWDFLIQKEKGLHDAALREQARAFKAKWLEDTARDSRARDLQAAWEQWKSEHIPQSLVTSAANEAVDDDKF